MEKESILKLIGIPETFGTTLLVLFLILVLTPYFSGSDFGIFKIPDLHESRKRKLKSFGPLLLIVTILLHIPFFKSVSEDNVTLQNPFGESQVLLNGQEILLAKKNLEKTSNTKNVKAFPKYLFQIEKIRENLDLKSEFINTMDYAKLLNKDTGWVSLQNHVKGNPVLRNGKVFRIYQDHSLNIKVSKDSYEGVKASSEKYKAAKEFMGNPFADISEFLDDEDQEFDKDERDSSFVEDFEKMDIEELQDEMKEHFMGDLEKVTFTMYNELSIVIVDKKEFELQAIAMNGGTEIQANPFYYLLSFGSILPYFNVQNVKDISVSQDSKVWAFYAERVLNNVYVNNEMQSKVHTDFYRIYAINSDYIYQITLSYTPSIDTPRKTWDELVRVLKSLRIINS